jgi:hypothetical protein
MPTGTDRLIVETIRLGNSVKVTVVDPASFLEATVVGPAHAGEQALVQTAIRKLDYLRAKSRG